MTEFIGPQPNAHADATLFKLVQNISDRLREIEGRQRDIQRDTTKAADRTGNGMPSNPWWVAIILTTIGALLITGLTTGLSWVFQTPKLAGDIQQLVTVVATLSTEQNRLAQTATRTEEVQKNMLAQMARVENALGSTVSRAETFEREQRQANGEFQRRALETEANSRERRLVSEAAEKQAEARLNAIMQQMATQQARIEQMAARIYELGRDRPALRQQRDEQPSGWIVPPIAPPPAAVMQARHHPPLPTD